MRLFFLYNSDRTHEMAGYESGSIPSHRLFGLMDVRRLGHESALYTTPRLLRVTKQFALLWRALQALYVLGRQRQLDYIIATHEANALPVLLLRYLRFLRTPILVVNVALLSRANISRGKKRLWKWLLPYAAGVISYASGQLDEMRTEFGLTADKLFFIPLGVDADFFEPAAGACASDYGLSVGTNEGKDFATLIKALPEGARWIIVTDSYNAGLIASLRPPANVEIYQAVPIVQLREWYRGARLHVIPLHETSYSTGQTVLLENMASGKLVLVSRTSAIVDYVEHLVSAICVAPEDAAGLQKAIDDAWNHPERYSNIGQTAAATVREQFSATRFAQRLIAVAERVDRERCRS